MDLRTQRTWHTLVNVLAYVRMLTLVLDSLPTEIEDKGTLRLLRQSVCAHGAPNINAKMAMHRSVLKRTVIFFIITTFITTNISSSQEVERENLPTENRRPVRAVPKKLGFFRTLFSVIYEQWSDTRNTTATIKNLINDNFEPENAPKVETTTSSDPNATTTEAPYRITRSEFNKIIMRNLRGLIRLYNIELKDALQQSDRNQVQFKKNASAEVSKFL